MTFDPTWRPSAHDAELKRLDADVNLHMERLIKAGQRFMVVRSPEAFHILATLKKGPALREMVRVVEALEPEQ